MERRYVGFDLHRRRSVIFIMNDAGQPCPAAGPMSGLDRAANIRVV